MDIVVRPSEAVDATTRAELRDLWARAFGDRFDDHDAEHAYGGVHVLAYDGERVVGHASAVPREIRFGDAPWRTVGYVEAVATAPARQCQGVGTALMTRLHDEIAARWPVALLSTGRATAFYERLGWQRWRGLSLTETTSGVVADGEHGGLMVWCADPSVGVEVTSSVTCRDRPGDAW